MTTLLLADHDGTSILDATRKALSAAKQLGGPVHVLVTGSAAAAEAAVRVSETILREKVSGEAAQDLVRRSLGEVRTRLQA